MPSQQITIPKAAGLYLQPNSLTVPEGAFEQADNIVITQDDVIKKRRGFGAFHSPVATLTTIVDYLGYLYAIYTNAIKRLDSSGNVDATYTGETVSVTSGTVAKTAQANGNLYFTNTTGILKVESLTDTTVYKAGIPSGLDCSVTLSGVTGVIAPDAQYLYRVVFGRRDGNNNLFLGAPSELFAVSNLLTHSATATNPGGNTVRVAATNHGMAVGTTIVIANSNDAEANGTYTITAIDGGVPATADWFEYTASGAVAGITTVDWGVYKTAAVEATLPSDIYNLSVSIGTKYFYQVYRTKETDSTLDPDNVDTYVTNESLKLVQEVQLTSTDLSNKYITYTDSIDDIFLGAFLYTNPNSGEGILQKNDRPPNSVQDIAFFKNHMFYANVVTDHTLPLDLISVTTAKMGNNDTITFTQGVTTKTYTAKGTENAASREFKLTNSGGGVSVANAVNLTARSLVKVINRDTSGLVYAYYVSSTDDAPGKMVFVSKVGATAFSVVANTAGGTTPGASFQPPLPTSGTTVISTNNTYTNALYISKNSEPEAVPAVNNILLGSRSLNILRIVALRDSLIVVTDQGVYRVNGDSTSTFQATLIDSTVPCLAKESVALLNNQVYYVSTQGIVSVSDITASIISRQIEPVISAVSGQSYFSAQTRAMGYESEHLYLLSTVSPQSSTADTVYCFNYLNNSWFQWDTVFKNGLVKASDDKMYYITSGNVVNKERKNQNKLDYTDLSYSLTIDSVSSDLLTATMTIVGASAAVGDVVVVDNVINRITEIDNSTGTIVYTFAQVVNFEATDSGTLYKGYTTTVKTAPQTGGDISRFKQFSEFQVSMRNQAVSRLNVKFATDSIAESSDVTWVNSQAVSGWGLFPWGGEPWGQSEGINSVYQTRSAPVIRTYIPMNTSRGTYIQAILTHTSAAEDMSIQSLSYTARAYGQRVTK